MGYYDPYPTHYLKAPLCLIGCVGSDIHKVGYFLSSMTGIPFIELTKKVEHYMGKTYAQSYDENLVSQWNEIEEYCLKKALKSNPAPIICLGEGTLLKIKNQKLCEKKSSLYYLRRPLTLIFKKLHEDFLFYAQQYPDLFETTPQNEEELYQRLKPYMVGYESAHVLIEMSHLSSLQVAQKVMKHLDLIQDKSKEA